ncbi:MAG: hypothetical protein KDE50_23380 [Caldilineaceae bacterium]|nr:hypothetical protein [Caldilineaceae bacterium]MCB0142861.1 hypothetical protein [Caldilineaceae bacterium]
MEGIRGGGSLKFGGCEIAQSGMNTLGYISLFELKLDLGQGVFEISIIEAPLLGSTNETLGKVILCGLTNVGHQTGASGVIHRFLFDQELAPGRKCVLLCHRPLAIHAMLS